ncbi:MAG: PfkB family carbohydrate kinase [Phycisphaerales bacterium]
MPLVVTGTIGIDTVHTPTAKAENVLGGSATYFAAAASFFGPVRLVAAAGEDLPDAFHKTIGHFGKIDTKGLEVRKGSRTFAWGGRYHENMVQRETLFTHLNILSEAPPTVPGAYSDSQFVFLGNTHPGIQQTFLSAFPKRRLTVADTMDLWINVAKPELMVLLRNVDGLALNNDEAELLTGKKNPVTAARHILEMGPRFVVVKKGEHGCILVHRDGLAALPAYPTENVVDPTGAGDTFAGGMMGSLAATAVAAPGGVLDAGSFEHVRRALVYGTVTASFTVESFSLDRLRGMTRKDLDARYHEYAAMVRV